MFFAIFIYLQLQKAFSIAWTLMLRLMGIFTFDPPKFDFDCHWPVVSQPYAVCMSYWRYGNWVSDLQRDNFQVIISTTGKTDFWITSESSDVSNFAVNYKEVPEEQTNVDGSKSVIQCNYTQMLGV